MKTLSYLLSLLLLSACSTVAVSSPIVINNQGQSFYPVEINTPSNNTKNRALESRSSIPALHKGQAMQAVNSHAKGTLTGVILVKTTDQESVLLIPAAKATAVGESFVLLSFGEETDLYSMLIEIKKRADVETAEIEVNTRRRKPR